ncbi:RNA polymerase sigma factor (sigma-70 family) [Hymenobacter sp. UYAg731]
MHAHSIARPIEGPAADTLRIGATLDYPEKALLQRLQARDERALNDFERRYGDALKTLVRRLVPDAGMAQDVWQECLLRLWQAFPHYDADRGGLAVWARAICRNVAIDELRAPRWRGLSHTQPLEMTVDAHNWPAPGGFQPEYIGLLALSQQLSLPQQQVIDLIYREDLSFEQTAQHLRLPLGTVKTHVRAAYQVLRQLAA